MSSSQKSHYFSFIKKRAAKSTMISFYHTKALKALSLIFILGIVQADSSGTCVTTEQGVCLPKSMVSNRRYAEAIESDSSHCSFAGTIVLGGPSSMEPGEKYFNLAKKQLASMSLVVDFVNKYQCGISLSSGNYSIDILTYDDESSTDLTTNIAEKLVSNNQVNALLGGYSSGLTGPLAEVVNKSTSHLLVAPGAASTGVFNDRDGVFGILPPTAKYTSQAIEGLANLGAKTIATVWEDASFTRGACGAIPDLADIYNLNITSTQEVVNAPNISVLTTVAEKLATESPDVVVTCVYDEGCVNWMKAMRNTGWSPKAQVFTICVGLNDFTQQIGTDANYIMGVTPWDSSLNIQDQVTGWSAEDFAGIYQSATSDTDITYHTAAAAAAISVIIQAIKQADAISETKAIRDIIASGTFQTMYGEVSFDNNGQSRAPSLLIQYDTNGTVQSVFPAEVSSGPILYPMPSFSQRDCMHLSDCEVSGDGTCNSNGECVCKNQEDFNSEGEGEDALCSHKEPDNVVYVTQGTNPVLSIVLPIALALVVVVVVFLFYEHNRKQNDSVWKVKREELTFDDPPELIGRGTFGVVILGEYRGTQVAVKRVIPSKKSKKSKRTGSESGTSSGYSSDGYASTDGYLSSSDRYLSSDDGDANKNRVDMTGGFGAKSWGIGALSTGGGVFTKSKAATAMTSIIGNMSRGKPTESPEEPMSRKQLKKDFMEEMRHLSKLRHPCVTTVMGAVVDEDPMLVMEYMDHGSLFDLLHNETMILEGETLLPILRDISQGVRFLHSAEPQVIHGDLKAQNILVDSKLHAKVADFGLSQKKKKNLRGTGTVSVTKYWEEVNQMFDSMLNLIIVF